MRVARMPRLWIGAGAVAGLALLGGADSAPPIVLQSPIGCQVGGPCLIQNYVDHDPGPAWKDQACGGQTYDGHDGVDIRVPDMAAVRRGVPVLAAAAGTVRGGRDGMDDVSVARVGKASLGGKECGNGVAVVHPGGWETQYCHMRKGSVVVKAGDRVAAGQALGMVGMSGNAEFPHLHITVRQDGKAVDPFAYGAPPGACGQGRSLWAPAAAAQFGYRSPALLNAGFAAAAPTGDVIEAGDIARPTATSAALVFYIRAVGLKRGDVAALKVTGPDGSVLAQAASQPMDRDKAQWFQFTGRKRPGGAFPAGRYRGELQVLRAGKPVLNKVVDLVL